MVIGACSLLGLMWPIFPTLGWSYYSLEGALTSCAVEWSSKKISVLSYNLTIFFLVFLIPSCIIIYSNIRIVLIVSKILVYPFKYKALIYN
jgi:hypothetical protein